MAESFTLLRSAFGMELGGSSDALIKTSRSALWGLALGSLIDNSLPQMLDDAQPMHMEIWWLAFQSGMNGLLTHVLRAWIDEEDALGGGLFFTTLINAQPRMIKRTTRISDMLNKTVYSPMGRRLLTMGDMPNVPEQFETNSSSMPPLGIVNTNKLNTQGYA
jgi:hypothetical protein